jgi:hypothetical protein
LWQKISAWVGLCQLAKDVSNYWNDWSDLLNSHSFSLAKAAPSHRTRSFANAICGCTRPPRPQSVLAMTLSRPTASAKEKKA